MDTHRHLIIFACLINYLPTYCLNLLNKATQRSTNGDQSSPSLATVSNKACFKIWCNVRLPKFVIPYHYNLHIKADVKRLYFEGEQKAFVKVLKPTDTILIHTKEMNISSVVVRSETDDAIDVLRHFQYPRNEYHVIILANKMPFGKYSIALNFNAKVSKKLTGFYKSSYMENGTEKILLTTKFQPTDARKAFPCFDEPDMKATYNISITHLKEYIARSNMPGVTVATPTSEEWLTTVFPQTVRMSTYLVAFIVSKFKSKFQSLSGINEHVKLAIWSRPEYVDITHYAFNMSKRMLPFIENFLDVKYSLPKLDMFAIPDYGSGATEHWGIITYRESRLLYQPEVTSGAAQKQIAAIIAHEISHLWFGNLVTCKWWNDLWVQEGMASYLEYYLLEDAHPEWNITNSYLSGEVQRGLKLDALHSSHPLSQPLSHPKQIKEIFDTITYRKGASLFGMLDAFLGTEIFRKGLNRYLTKYAYKGATVDNLWDAFSEVCDIDIKEMMNTWTLQMGFPVITIKKVKTDTYSLYQERFLLDRSDQVTKPSKYGYQWIVPFKYAASNDLKEAKVKVLRNFETNITSPSDWLLGNYLHKGFYRVNYDMKGWEHIINNMITNHKLFTVTDRAGILDDVFSLARAGTITYAIPFRLSQYLHKEESDFVWKVFMNNLSFLDTVLSSQDYYGLFRVWYASLLKERVKIRRTPRLISTACKVEEKYTILFVKRSFKQWMEDGVPVPENIRKQVYFCAIANGGDAEWDYVYDKYRNATNPSERSNLLFALSATQKPWILNKWLRYSIDPSKVRSQDMVYVIRNIASNNPIGKVYAWQFAENHWEHMMDIAKENNFHVNALVSGLTSRFVSESDLKKVQQLWKRYPDAGSGKGARQQGIEYIKININWLKRNGKKMELLFNGGSLNYVTI